MVSALQERMIIGYHGCDRTVGEDVLLRGAPLRPSNNEWDWLGRGIYFWEHGPARAWQWAEAQHKRGKIKGPFVLGAFIHLGHCLDLTDTAAIALVQRWHTGLKQSMERQSAPMPENRPLHEKDADRIMRHLDCAVINFGLDLGESYDKEKGEGERRKNFQTVRGVFTEGGPAYDGACIQSKTHVQVAVQDADCIVGYFKPVAHGKE